jgi:hypothetical protein
LRPESRCARGDGRPDAGLNAIAEAQEKNSEAALTLALGKLRTFFKIMGIMALIGMALAVLSVLILIPLALLAPGRMGSPAVVPMPQG